MATVDMKMVLGGLVLPYPAGFEKEDIPNEVDVITQGGMLYTDFTNINRQWKVSWDFISRENVQLIYNLYLQQYQQHRYHTLQMPAYNILAPVKIEKSQEEIKFNGALIRNFSIILKEQYPFS